MTAAHIIAATAVPLGTLLGFFVARIAGAVGRTAGRPQGALAAADS